MPIYMSRELLLSTPATKRQPKVNAQQLKINKDTTELFDACMNELCFVMKAQPFPYHHVYRKADEMMRLDTSMMTILNNRPLVTAKVFESDQIILGKIIEDWQKEIRVQYKALYEFLLEAEEYYAFEAFRKMFDLDDIQEKTSEERHRENLVRRRYSWIGGASKVEWLYRELQYYIDWIFLTDPYKAKILARFAPH